MPPIKTWSGSVALDNDILTDSDEKNVHCLRNIINSVLNDVLKKDSECDKTYCDDEHIHDICPVLFDFRKQFTQNFVFAHVDINSFRHKYGFIRENTADFSLLLNQKLIIVIPMRTFMCQITSCTDRIYRHLAEVCSLYIMTLYCIFLHFLEVVY